MGNRIEIEIRGCVNGVPIEVVGKVEIEESGALIELRAIQTAFHWDHALLAQPLLDLAFATSGAVLDDPIAARVRLDIFDEDGREVGEVSMSALVSKVDGAVRLVGEVQRGVCRLELGEAVMGIEAARQSESLMLGLGFTVITSAWSYRTSRGHGYGSVATVTVGGGNVTEVRRTEFQAIVVRDVPVDGSELFAIKINSARQ